MEDYAAHLRGLVDLTAHPPPEGPSSTPGNGMGGHTVPTVFAGLPLTLVPMYFELDGSFPNHEANPLGPGQHRRPPGTRPRGSPPTWALAFDGDADRCASSTRTATRSRRPRSPPWWPPASWRRTAARA
ncbi:hypothetical protein ACRAWF_08615 [Streptomyces sp. L7]